LHQPHLGSVWVQGCPCDAIPRLSDGGLAILVECNRYRLPKGREYLGLEIGSWPKGSIEALFHSENVRMRKQSGCLVIDSLQNYQALRLAMLCFIVYEITKINCRSNGTMCRCFTDPRFGADLLARQHHLAIGGEPSARVNLPPLAFVAGLAARRTTKSTTARTFSVTPRPDVSAKTLEKILYATL
jgi:hypothetical protein